jgi:RNA polymerase sigma-70 factor (ECF subfamily)
VIKITENNLTDHSLVEKVLSGDTNTFSIIISNTERLVAQIVFKMITNDEDKKDIAQDIYLKAYQKLATFNFHSKLSTWIGQIAYNTCLNHLEKKKLILLDSFYTDDETDNEKFEKLNNDINSQNNETEILFLNTELSQILKNETDKLSPLYKTLITLFHSEELSYSEIAQITELPEGTIKNYLFRARKMLRTNLLQNYKKEEL